MKQILAKSIIVLFIGIVAVVFTGCLKNEDLLTDGVRTGGLVEPTASIFYKQGTTVSFNVKITIPRGAGIDTIRVYKQFFHNADTTESNKILLTKVIVNHENATAETSKTITLTWAEMIAGLTLPDYTIPSDDQLSDIGDYFVLSYGSIMHSDKKEIYNVNETNVSVANFFSGSFHVSGYFYHPTAPREINEDKDLVSINKTKCKTLYADFGSATMILFITIDPITYDISLDQSGAYATTLGDPNDASHVCSYNSTTGVIELWYYYSGSNGYRIIHEIYTPIPVE